MVTKEQHSAWKRKWRSANPEKTKQAQTRANAKLKESGYTLAYSRRDYVRKKKAQARDDRRQFILTFFGGKCIRCGFTDGRALQMDHINGRNGVARLGNIDSRFAFVRDNPTEAKKIYQLLCANCNFIKREENFEHFYHGVSRLSS